MICSSQEARSGLVRLGCSRWQTKGYIFEAETNMISSWSQKIYVKPAEEMLKKYFESKDDVAETLLKTDQSLTEAAREIEVERIKAEAAEATNRDLAEKQKKYELMMAEKEKSYQEHVKQLTEKMQQEREQLIAENEKIISLKLKEQERLLKEGFQNESRKLHQEIESIKKSQSSGKCTIL